MTTEPQAAPQNEKRLVKIGKITVEVAPVKEEMLIAIDLRRRVAEVSGTDEDMVDVIQEATKDLLINLVVNPNDIGKIITELSSGRVGMDELIETLTGVTTGGRNREERRESARVRQNPRRGKRGGRR